MFTLQVGYEHTSLKLYFNVLPLDHRKPICSAEILETNILDIIQL